MSGKVAPSYVLMDLDTPPFAIVMKGPGDWRELRLDAEGRLYMIDPKNPMAPPVVIGVIPKDLVAASSGLASEEAFMTYSGAAARYGGYDYVQKVGSVNSSTPGFKSIVFPSANGKYYERQYSGFAFYSEWFGIVGNGTADDTVAIQKFFDACHAYNAVAVFQANKLYKITGSVNLRNGMVGVVMPPSSAICPAGSGYTAVTTDTGFVYTQFFMRIVGSGNACNGLQLNNPQRSEIAWIRVENLAGSGCKIVTVWDSTFTHISVENCGSATEFAFSVIGGSDTSNKSHFCRLQVENSRKPIQIGGNTIACVFDNIHSEGAKAGNSLETSYEIGGVRCTYNNVQLHSASANVKVKFHGSGTTFEEPQIEGSISAIEINSWDDAGGLLEFRNMMTLTGRMEKTGNGRALISSANSIYKIEGLTSNFVIENAHIVNLGIGFTPAGTNLVVRNSQVDSLYFEQVQGRVLLEGCNISTATIAAGSSTFLRRSKIQLGTATIGYCWFHLMDGSELVGNITVDTAHFLATNQSKLIGNLTIPANNGRQNEFDASFRVSGTVAGFAVNNANQYASFTSGARCYNPKYTAGGINYIITSNGSAWIAVNYPAQP